MNFKFIDTKTTNWEEEAETLYRRILKEESRYGNEISIIFTKYKNLLKKELDQNKQQILYQDLEKELIKIKHSDDNLQRNLFFILFIKKMTKEIKNEIQKKTEKPKIQIIEEVFDKFESRAEIIFQVDLMKYTNQERYEYFKLKGVKLKTTRHIFDAKTGRDSKYFASLEQIKPIDENFGYEWEGKTRSFLYPPDRPNDRGILMPVV